MLFEQVRTVEIAKRNIVGLLEKLVFPNSNTRKLTCGIYFGTYPCAQVESVACDHPYCYSCWAGHIGTSTNDSLGCLVLRCPNPICGAANGQDMIKLLAYDEDKEKYDYYLLKSYIEDNKKARTHPVATSTAPTTLALLRASAICVGKIVMDEMTYSTMEEINQSHSAILLLPGSGDYHDLTFPFPISLCVIWEVVEHGIDSMRRFVPRVMLMDLEPMTMDNDRSSPMVRFSSLITLSSSNPVPETTRPKVCKDSVLQSCQTFEKCSQGKFRSVSELSSTADTSCGIVVIDLLSIASIRFDRSLRGRTGEANISDGSEVLEAEDLFKEVIGKSVQRVIRHEHRFECGLGRVRVESGERVGNAEIT
ncbi:hypothetical protein JHK86_022902 [Glycine max]|nr:hypothetical protein JHK86_022902 [Glycine max]